jgi:predicted small secreted protein
VAEGSTASAGGARKDRGARDVPFWLVLGAAALAACGRGAGAGADDRPGQVESVLLEAADAADGPKDRVVAKRTVCGLGMDGTREHASRYAGYDLRFCSDE